MGAFQAGPGRFGSAIGIRRPRVGGKTGQCAVSISLRDGASFELAAGGGGNRAAPNRDQFIQLQPSRGNDLTSQSVGFGLVDDAVQWAFQHNHDAFVDPETCDFGPVLLGFPANDELDVVGESVFSVDNEHLVLPAKDDDFVVYKKTQVVGVAEAFLVERVQLLPAHIGFGGHAVAAQFDRSGPGTPGAASMRTS